MATERERPEIVEVIKEMTLVGRHFDIYTCTYGKVQDSETYTCDTKTETCADPDPAQQYVQQGMIFTEGVCALTEARLRAPLKSFEMRFVLPDTVRFADEVSMTLRAP